MNSRALLLAVLSSTFVVACADLEKTEESSSELSQTVDQVGGDVQVLQIWTAGRVFPLGPQPWMGASPNDVAIHADVPETCSELRRWTVESSSRWQEAEVDCTSALSKLATFNVTGESGPAMTPVRFHLSQRENDSTIFADPDFCSRVETRVVVRDAASSQASFAGIGFYTSRGDSFTPKSELQAVGQTRLKDGAAATVYRFVGISTCISSAHSSTSGNMYQTFSFKPYIAHDVTTPSGTQRYRIWENLHTNHVIGRSWPGETPVVDRTSFDRQDELLAR